jgi:hypothetical protein
MSKIYLFFSSILAIALSCREADVVFQDDTAIEALKFSTEKLSLELPNTLQWQSDIQSNYLQKDILCKDCDSLKVLVSSENFCGGPYVFRVVGLVEKKLTFRRNVTLTFPTEITIDLNPNVTSSIQTYIQRNNSVKDNCENIGKVTCKVFCK